MWLWLIRGGDEVSEQTLASNTNPAGLCLTMDKAEKGKTSIEKNVFKPDRSYPPLPRGATGNVSFFSAVKNNI